MEMHLPWKYHGATNTIEIIVDPEFPGHLLSLAATRCVWIVDTPGNQQAIDNAWGAGGEMNLCEVSRCKVENPESRQENLLTIMGMLDDHYLTYDMIVHGLEPSEVMKQLLREEEGFEVSEPTPDGFVARRVPGIREHFLGRAAPEGERS